MCGKISFLKNFRDIKLHNKVSYNNLISRKKSNRSAVKFQNWNTACNTVWKKEKFTSKIFSSNQFRVKFFGNMTGLRQYRCSKISYFLHCALWTLQKFTVSRWKKFRQINYTFSNFFSSNVTFTKFLRVRVNFRNFTLCTVAHKLWKLPYNKK